MCSNIHHVPSLSCLMLLQFAANLKTPGPLLVLYCQSIGSTVSSWPLLDHHVTFTLGLTSNGKSNMKTSCFHHFLRIDRSNIRGKFKNKEKKIKVSLELEVWSVVLNPWLCPKMEIWAIKSLLPAPRLAVHWRALSTSVCLSSLSQIWDLDNLLHHTRP